MQQVIETIFLILIGYFAGKGFAATVDLLSWL